MNVTFRKGKTRNGMMRLPDTYRIMHEQREVGVVQRIQNSDLWFWYTLVGDSFVNTAHTPAPLDRVKIAAKDWFLRHTTP